MHRYEEERTTSIVKGTASRSLMPETREDGTIDDSVPLNAILHDELSTGTIDGHRRGNVF